MQPSDHTTLDRAAVNVARTRDHDALAVIGGRVDGELHSTLSTIAGRFNSATLVTIRSQGGGGDMRWIGGIHLDGANAEHALRQWGAESVAHRSSAAPRRVAS